MIDIKLVQQEYSKMSDPQLLQFAINESNSLTIEAFHLLKAEFAKRNLNIGILEKAEIENALFEIAKQNKVEENLIKDYERTLIRFVPEEKLKEKTTSEIFQNLLQKGIDENIAFLLINTLSTNIKSIIDHLHTGLLMSWTFLGIGLVLSFLWFSKSIDSMLFVLGLLFLIGGFISLIKSIVEIQKYKDLLIKLDDEERIDRGNHSKTENFHLN